MTNFEPLKEAVWKAAQSGDRKVFDRQCDALMEKAVGDWWRIGWSIGPKTVEDVVTLLENAAKSAHAAWVRAMECGDAPPEDISPGEGFSVCAELIKKAKGTNHEENHSDK